MSGNPFLKEWTAINSNDTRPDEESKCAICDKPFDSNMATQIRCASSLCDNPWYHFDCLKLEDYHDDRLRLPWWFCPICWCHIKEYRNLSARLFGKYHKHKDRRVMEKDSNTVSDSMDGHSEDIRIRYSDSPSSVQILIFLLTILYGIHNITTQLLCINE